MRAAWPAARPMSVRLSAHDWAPGGNTPDDAAAMARLSKAARARTVLCVLRPDHARGGAGVRPDQPGRRPPTASATRPASRPWRWVRSSSRTMSTASSPPGAPTSARSAGRISADPYWTLRAAAALGYADQPCDRSTSPARPNSNATSRVPRSKPRRCRRRTDGPRQDRFREPRRDHRRARRHRPRDRARAVRGGRIAHAPRPRSLAASDDAVQGMPEGTRCDAQVCDLARPADIVRAFEGIARAGHRVSILVNNAGVAQSARVGATDDAMLDAMLGVNLAGAFRSARRPRCRRCWRCRRGRIVNVASTAGLVGASRRRGLLRDQARTRRVHARARPRAAPPPPVTVTRCVPATRTPTSSARQSRRWSRGPDVPRAGACCARVAQSAETPGRAGGSRRRRGLALPARVPFGDRPGDRDRRRRDRGLRRTA